jgi:hypothetical protein
MAQMGFETHMNDASITTWHYLTSLVLSEFSPDTNPNVEQVQGSARIHIVCKHQLYSVKQTI